MAETDDVDSWVLSSAEGMVVDRVCGPSLSITASVPGQAGAAWYARMQTVDEGFDTTFTFRLSSPSTKCLINDAHSKCRSRGGHGLAFVLHSESPVAIGMEGNGIGYEGLRNALIVEFDTFHNPEVSAQNDILVDIWYFAAVVTCPPLQYSSRACSLSRSWTLMRTTYLSLQAVWIPQQNLITLFHWEIVLMSLT